MGKKIEPGAIRKVPKSRFQETIKILIIKLSIHKAFDLAFSWRQ